MVSFETYHISYSIYKHDAIDIAYPSSMQDVCHMNFVLDLAHRSLCGSVVEHRNAETEGLRFDSSWGLGEFFLCPTLVTRRKTYFSMNDSFPIFTVKEYQASRDMV